MSTFTFNNVYIKGVSTIVGPYEKKGPLGKMFDKSYDNLYCNTKSWEKAEEKLLKESMLKVLKKTSLEKEDIDLVIAGDLSNQLSTSTYASKILNRAFMGVYTACATNVEAIIMGASMITANLINKCMCSVSSHNMSSEKQFRNPTEYGAPKPLTSTKTSTGGASIVLTNEKTSIKVEKGTIGRIVDPKLKDPLDMGSVMALAAADTIKKHLEETNRDANYYDLIVTGDLGLYGKEILKDYLLSKYNINISNNYNDCGVMLYDLDTQKDFHAGGSGPVCSALVLYTRIFNDMIMGKYKKVLMVATGALFNPIYLFQKENILSIANAVSLEVV